MILRNVLVDLCPESVLIPRGSMYTEMTTSQTFRNAGTSAKPSIRIDLFGGETKSYKLPDWVAFPHWALDLQNTPYSFRHIVVSVVDVHNVVGDVDAVVVRIERLRAGRSWIQTLLEARLHRSFHIFWKQPMNKITPPAPSGRIGCSSLLMQMANKYNNFAYENWNEKLNKIEKVISF